MDPENRATRRLGASRVPASARSPESMRGTAYDGGPLDEADEDVDFIASLAREAAETVTTPSPARQPAPVKRFTVPVDDALDAFRDIRVERPRPRVLTSIGVDEVDMDDLLVQLSTTAAALRLRKAA